MRLGRVIALAILFAPLVVASSCGGDSDDMRARQQNAPYTATTRPFIPPAQDLGPSPENMPGGGRGSDPPHFKGKP
jgi:hypothetical protein